MTKGAGMAQKDVVDAGKEKGRREIRIEYMRLDEILRNPANPKDHDLSALAESLERFGFVSPMGINEETGKLLWGHGRLDDLVAFMDEGRPALGGIQVDGDGMWKAPVVRGVHLDAEDGTAYLVADNRQVELGGWNEPKLVETLIRIAGGDGRGLRGTGYDGDDVDALIRLIHGPKEFPEYGEGLEVSDAEAARYAADGSPLACPECGAKFRVSAAFKAMRGKDG